MERKPTSASRNYDVFLAHGSGDKPLVNEIYETLLSKDYSVFLDSEELNAGAVWRPKLEDALRESRCFVICAGPAGPGPWTELEVDFALRRNRQEPSFKVVPVLMPGGSNTHLEQLSELLPSFQYIDLRGGLSVELGEARLIEMINRALTGSIQGNQPPGHLPVGDVQRGLKRLQDRFTDSLRPLLAGGQMIQRQETQQLIEDLESNETRIVVVHGVAGSGKSGVLLELADRLSRESQPFLALRLDRQPLRSTPHRFATAELLLPGSPGACLATLGSDEHRAFLILDQLDALRWTGAHSSEAWDVCREMIQEALSASPKIKVVVCCRTFDLQHDPQLRTWKKELKHLREVRIGNLSSEQVRAAIEQAASSKGGARPVAESELRLLQHIHHLQMWLHLYPKLGSQGSLSTRRALMEAFWQDRRTQLNNLEISQDRIEKIEIRLVEEMEEGSQLTAPLGALRLSSHECKAYQSLQILQVDEASNRISFCHQTYLDYLVALQIVTRLKKNAKSLLNWLGTKDNQSLFRREQLRLVLEELRDRKGASYLTELGSVLEAGKAVRFHLRLLCLQFLSQLNEPDPAKQKLILNLLEDPYWREHVLGDVVLGQEPWFEVLDDAGIFEQWLAGTDDKLRESALQMLLYVVETCGDRVARLLRPYLQKSEEWTHRILWVIRFEPTKDTEDLFDLRLALAQAGAYKGDHVGWAELAEEYPFRFLKLTCHILLARAKRILENKRQHLVEHRTKLDWYHFDEVTASLIPPDLQSLAWEMLFKTIMAVAKIKLLPVERDRTLEAHTVDFEALKPVIRLLRDLGRSLLHEDWSAFVDQGERLSRGSWRGELLFLDSLKEGPANPDLADWALGWLMADPWRARLQLTILSDPNQLSGQLVERYAPVCSNETFQRLEKWLLGYREPDFLERYKNRHEWIQQTGDLKYPSSLGLTQHALLPVLPSDRASEKVAKRIVELNRKFGAPKVDQIIEAEYGGGGWVKSPLGSEVLESMSDRALLKLATSEKLRGNSRSKRPKWKEDFVELASAETIISDFRIATQRNSERFSRLLTRWPDDGHGAFLKAILSGLAFPGDRARKNDTKTWQPPSHSLLEEILSHPMVQARARSENDTEVAANLCDLLQRYAQYSWTDEALDFVVWVSQHHPDPSPDYFPLGSSGIDPDQLDRLDANALNVTRGRAGFALQSLLFKHPEFFAKLQPAIEHLAHDQHPAVRTAAMAAWIPVIKIDIDKDLAVEFFLEACKGQDSLLATRTASNFLRYSYQTHLYRLLPTFDRMLASPVSRVTTAGASFVAAAFLVMGEVQERFEQCIAGGPERRRGVAQVAASLIGEGEYAEKALETLLRLAEDLDEEVARTVARSFRQLDLRLITKNREAWSRFARSKAFQTEPSELLMALDQQSGNLLPFADCLLAAGKTFAEELAEASRDRGRGFAGRASHYLLPLLLRLYEQAKEQNQEIYRRCLDLWDRLLEQRVGSAMGLTHELDRL